MPVAVELPLAPYKATIQLVFERLILITSAGFALACSSAVSVAVATSLFGASDAKSMEKLRNAADLFAHAGATYGLGFFSSVLAILVPVSRLDHFDRRMAAMAFLPPTYFLFLAPLWASLWATLTFGRGMQMMFDHIPVWRFFALLPTLLVMIPTFFLLLL